MFMYKMGCVAFLPPNAYTHCLKQLHYLSSLRAAFWKKIWGSMVSLGGI